MRLLLAMLGFFILAQIIGVFTGSVIISDLERNPYVGGLVVTTDADEPANAGIFILYVLIGAAIMILLIRKLHIFPIIFVLMEFMLISSSSSVVFYAVLRTVLGYGESTAIAIGLGLAFSAIRAFVPGLKNAAAILATAGVGTIFGISLGLFPLILFLIFLSIYDFAAVFFTKHMVEMADFIVKKDMAFTVTAKAPPPKKGMKEQRIDLGTGDMIAPIMMEVSALSFSPVATAFVFVGAVVSLGLFLVLVYRSKMVLPALPPIALGMIASLFLGFLLGFY
ncbi:MAG: presenilin family intramembrane aspartyl protease [Candidatus Micrarchaeota archaeon]